MGEEGGGKKKKKPAELAMKGEALKKVSDGNIK